MKKTTKTNITLENLEDMNEKLNAFIETLNPEESKVMSVLLARAANGKITQEELDSYLQFNKESSVKESLPFIARAVDGLSRLPLTEADVWSYNVWTYNHK